jgi:3-isopropylmalate dehydrogenase
VQASIAALPGDGIGPEVVAEGIRVLQTVAVRWGHDFQLSDAAIGGCAIDAVGTALPEATLELCRRSDAVLLGAVGGPRWDDPRAAVRPEQGLLALRRQLELFANLRPVTVHPRGAVASPLRAELLRGVDLLVVRELTGGIYFGAKRRTQLPGGECAEDVCTYTTMEIERVVRVAAELARSRRGKLTSVDKANVLETSRLWRSVTARVMAAEFPDVTLEHLLVDACAMHLLRRPAEFDVIVTENMFGDILTDEVAMLAGSLGLLPSASLGEAGDDGGTRAARTRTTRLGVYEPIHGSAPDIAGRGVANPIGTILSVAMLLRHSLALETEASAVERAVHSALTDGWVTADLAQLGAQARGTREVGREICERISGIGDELSSITRGTIASARRVSKMPESRHENA